MICVTSHGLSIRVTLSGGYYRRRCGILLGLSTGCWIVLGLSTVRLFSLMMSYPLASIEGMNTAVLAKQQLQETISVLETSLPDASEADCIEILQLVEQAKRKLAAVQAQATHALIEQREAAEAEDGIPKSKRLGGVDAEVGLARGESPFVGAALTRLATALCSVLPHTLTALRVGRVSEYHARIVAEQTTHLSEAHRRKIDELIAHRLGKASSSQLRKLIEGHALRLDREAAEQRAAVNKAQRRVWMEPAGDGTSYLTAQVATHDAVAVMDVLHQRANQRRIEAAADNPDAPLLSHNQIQADLFVELLTGQLPGPGVTAEVMVLMEDTTLFGDDDQPAWIPGHGPVPAGIIKDWLADPTVKAFLRRMYTRPSDGQLVAMESRRREIGRASCREGAQGRGGAGGSKTTIE